MDVLVAGQGAEFVDPGFDVVAGDRLPGLYRGEVHLADDRFVGLDHPVGHVEAEAALGPQDGQPQPALQHHPALGRPHRGHGPAGVALGQNVGHGCSLPRSRNWWRAGPTPTSRTGTPISVSMNDM